MLTATQLLCAGARQYTKYLACVVSFKLKKLYEVGTCYLILAVENNKLHFFSVTQEIVILHWRVEKLFITAFCHLMTQGPPCGADIWSIWLPRCISQNCLGPTFNFINTELLVALWIVTLFHSSFSSHKLCL